MAVSVSNQCLVWVITVCHPVKIMLRKLYKYCLQCIVDHLFCLLKFLLCTQTHVYFHVLSIVLQERICHITGQSLCNAIFGVIELDCLISALLYKGIILL